MLRAVHRAAPIEEGFTVEGSGGFDSRPPPPHVPRSGDHDEAAGGVAQRRVAQTASRSRAPVSLLGCRNLDIALASI